MHDVNGRICSTRKSYFLLRNWGRSQKSDCYPWYSSRSFLGHVRYYRRSTKDLNIILAPLLTLLSKNKGQVLKIGSNRIIDNEIFDIAIREQ